MEPYDLQNSTKTGMTRCKKQSEAGQVSRKKKKVDCFALLPDDLLLDILKKLPGDILRYKTRFVCKRFSSLITDRILLDHASLILENSSYFARRRLMDITEVNQGLKTKDQSLEIPYKGRIKSWCNEFLLITDNKKNGTLCIYDLITKKGSFLPPCTTVCGGHYGCKCGVGLSYDKFKGLYKVVHVFLGTQIQCELLTLKGDITSCNSLTWKRINGPYYTGQRKYYWDDPVSVQGRYFHWDVHCSKYLASMDTVKERFRQTRLPDSAAFPMTKRYSFVEMGGFLTLLHKFCVDKVNVWALRDYQRSKWEKLQSITLPSCISSHIFHPVTCVKSKRCIIFKKAGYETGLYCYDLKNKTMRRLDVDVAPDERCVVQSAAAGFCDVGSACRL